MEETQALHFSHVVVNDPSVYDTKRAARNFCGRRHDASRGSSNQWIGLSFISNYETVLNTISFLHTGEDPTEGSRDFRVLMILDLTQHSINSYYLTVQR